VLADAPPGRQTIVLFLQAHSASPAVRANGSTANGSTAVEFTIA
jgi:hypothetical protein